MSQPKTCPKCKVIISRPDANFCKRHAGKNPRLSKEFEASLIAYVKRHFPHMLKHSK